MKGQRYYLFPTLYKDQIIFRSDDDLWRVEKVEARPHASPIIGGPPINPASLPTVSGWPLLDKSLANGIATL